MQEFCASIGKPACPECWHPIASAPLDGIPIRVRDGGYAPFIATHITRAEGGGCWIFDADVSFAPTHWQHI
jgi:hypothetical protein